MNWCVADQFQKANHNPIVVLNGDRTKQVLSLSAKSGSAVKLSAEGTSDPDNNSVRVTWWIYREAGTLMAEATLSRAEGLTTEVRLPEGKESGTVHVILQVEDGGSLHLWGYRRMVIQVMP
jgi:hypothetical protein